MDNIITIRDGLETKYWNGRRWTTDIRNAYVFKTHRGAFVRCEQLLRRLNNFGAMVVRGDDPMAGIFNNA